MDERKERLILRHVTAAVLDSSLRGNLLKTVAEAAREQGVELDASDREVLTAVVEDLERFAKGNKLDELNAEIWSMGVLGGRMSPVPLEVVERFPVDMKGGRMSKQKKPETKGGHMSTRRMPGPREGGRMSPVKSADKRDKSRAMKE